MAQPRPVAVVQLAEVEIVRKNVIWLEKSHHCIVGPVLEVFGHIMDQGIVGLPGDGMDELARGREWRLLIQVLVGHPRIANKSFKAIDRIDTIIALEVVGAPIGIESNDRVNSINSLKGFVSNT